MAHLHIFVQNVSERLWSVQLIQEECCFYFNVLLFNFYFFEFLPEQHSHVCVPMCACPGYVCDT